MCGKSLADFGADVILIEPPGGHPSRFHGPYPGGIEDPEKSFQFLYLNANKRSLVLDLTKKQDSSQLRHLISKSDLFITDLKPFEAEKEHLAFKDIRELNDQTIVTYVTPFGHFGPYKNYSGEELVLWHMGGLGYETPAFTVTDLASQPPLKSGGYNVEYFAGWTAATASMIGIFYRDRYGSGQMIDIAAMDSAMNHIRGNFATFSYDIASLPENRLKSFFTWIWPCKDGHVSMSIVADHWWKLLVEEMGNPAWATNTDFDTLEGRRDSVEEIEAGVMAWMRSFTKNELFERLSGKGIACFPVYSTDEVIKSPQYVARDFFVEQNHPKAGKVTQPGPPIRMSKTPWRLDSPAPLLNQHADEIIRDIGFPPSINAEPLKKTKGARPLEGVRVLDMGWILSVPHCGAWLGTLGAEVIEVESMASLDLGRKVALGGGADGTPGINRNSNYNSLNFSKNGFTVNLKTKEGLDLFKELVAISDVVIENFATDVMNNLGCGFRDLLVHRPDIVMLSGSTLGVEGPQRLASGFGPNVSSYAGLPYISGYQGGPPMNMGGNWPDYLVGTMMVFSILSALRHRAKTGEGQFIEFSMAECVSSLLPEAFMDWSMNGVQHQRIGNRHAKYAPHNVYPCSGFDQWAAISVTSEEEWRTLCRVSGHKEWISNPLFSTENGRKLNEDELDKLISQWTKTTSPVELMKSLQEAGVSAGPVMSVFDLVSNPHVMERGFLVDIDHDEVGPRTVAGLPLRMGEIDKFDYTPTPLFGQHNELIGKDLLGYPKKRYDELVNREVIY